MVVEEIDTVKQHVMMMMQMKALNRPSWWEERISWDRGGNTDPTATDSGGMWSYWAQFFSSWALSRIWESYEN